MRDALRGLWGFRQFVVSSVRTEFRGRFARSKLGGLWGVLHPLALVLIYALILSQIMSAKLPGVVSEFAYPIYILSGMVAWSLFSEIFGRSLSVFIDNGNLIKKLAFPKLTLPLITLGSALVNFLLLLLMMFGVFGVLGHLPFHALLWLPLLVVLTMALALGMGLFFGILNVFMRDVGQVFNIVLQFWFWLTPIVYMPSIVPKAFESWLFWNPMTGVTMGFQSVLLYDRAPDLGLLVFPAGVAVCFLGLTWGLFRKASGEMADVL